jgi:hypothetical protein
MDCLSFSCGTAIVQLMSTKAQAILDELLALPPGEQREVSNFILQHLVSFSPPTHRRTIADIAGKYRVNPDPEAKDHDLGFAAAAAD